MHKHACVCLFVGSLSFHIEFVNYKNVGIKFLSASQPQQNIDLSEH